MNQYNIVQLSTNTLSTREIKTRLT